MDIHDRFALPDLYATFFGRNLRPRNGRRLHCLCHPCRRVRPAQVGRLERLCTRGSVLAGVSISNPMQAAAAAWPSRTMLDACHHFRPPCAGDRREEESALRTDVLVIYMRFHNRSFLPAARLTFSNQLQFTKLRQFGDENVVRGKAAGDLMIARQVSVRALHASPPCAALQTSHREPLPHPVATPCTAQ